MKKFKNISLFLFAAVAMTVLTSCDDMVADELQGHWYGEVATANFSYHRGINIDYQEVEIYFDKGPGNNASGTGIEIDYENNGWYYTECPFTFNVRDGIIYMDYEDGTHVAIKDYSIHEDVNNGDMYTFQGVFVDYYTGREMAQFKLYKRGDYYYNDKTYNWRKR